MLLLSEADVQEILPMAKALERLEASFHEQHQGAVFATSLPAPGELLPLAVLGPFEAHLPEIVLERMVRLRVREDLQVDNHIHVERSGMGGHRRRPGTADRPLLD